MPEFGLDVGGGGSALYSCADISGTGGACGDDGRAVIFAPRGSDPAIAEFCRAFTANPDPVRQLIDGKLSAVQSRAGVCDRRK